MTNKKMNPVVHFEMLAEDKMRVKKFYEETFGWEMIQTGHDMGNYLLANTSPVDENNMHINKGAINGGFYEKGEYGTSTHIVIEVDDLDNYIKMVEKFGGKIQSKAMDIQGIGKFVMFMDTEGNSVGMLQPLKIINN
jgi:hypothetical protein